MDGLSLVTGGASLVASIVLVVITWRYARSTEVIASETAKAANASRDAAQINLLQSLLTVQPILEVSDLHVTFVHAEEHNMASVRVPVRVAWRVCNLGAGIAFTPEFEAAFKGVALNPVHHGTLQRHLSSGDSAELEHTVLPEVRSSVAARLIDSPSSTIGSLTLKCRDAFGAAVETGVEIRLSGDGVHCSPPRRTYEGILTLQEQVHRLLGRLLFEPKRE